MRHLTLVFALLFSTMAHAEVSPAQWLGNCLAQPVPDLNQAETEIFIQQADIECLSSFIVVCKGFESADLCIEEGISFLNSEFDEAVAAFPDFSAEESSFLLRHYQDLADASSSDPLDAVEGCDPELIECDYLGRAMRLIAIRQSSRAIVSKW